jgi:Beta-propeller repeat
MQRAVIWRASVWQHHRCWAVAATALPEIALQQLLWRQRGEEGHGIAVDRSGNAYLTGITFSSNFLLSHPIQAHKRGSENAFVAKISSQ